VCVCLFVCVCVCGVCGVLWNRLLFWTGPTIQAHFGFRHVINRQKASSQKAIRRWIGQWREEGCRV
jgi:hypothetical protein